VVTLYRLHATLANFNFFRPIHSGEFHHRRAGRMLADDDWKDEEKDANILMIP
jgi:hypothetical protein